MAFTKTFLTLLNDCLKMRTTELIYTIDEILYNVYEAQIKYIENILRNELNLEVSKYE